MLRSIAYAFVLLLALCAPTRAQGTAAPPPNYQAVLDEAIREFSARNYSESLILFRDAHRQWPSARALRAIGRCQYELGDYVGAHQSLEEALGTGIRPLEPAQRSETEQLLARVRERVARYMIVTEPPSASVRVDGVAVALDDYGNVMLPVGQHSLEATATGYLPAHREINVVAQRDERVELRLVPLSEPEPTMDATPESPMSEAPTQVDQPLRKKWWLWTSVGGAAVVAVVAAVLIAGRDDPQPERPSGGTSGIAIGVPSASP